MVEIYIESLRARHQEECIFICGSGPKKATLVAAPFEHKRLTAKRIGILHYQTVRKPIATEYVWEGMWLEDKQGVWNPHVGKLLGTQRYPKLHLSCSSNQNVNGITPLPSASMFRYAPPICDYVPHTSRLPLSNLHENQGLRLFEPSIVLRSTRTGCPTTSARHTLLPRCAQNSFLTCAL